MVGSDLVRSEHHGLGHRGEVYERRPTQRNGAAWWPWETALEVETGSVPRNLPLLDDVTRPVDAAIRARDNLERIRHGSWDLNRRVAMALVESCMTRLSIAELLLIPSHQVDQLLISPTPQPLGL